MKKPIETKNSLPITSARRINSKVEICLTLALLLAVASFSNSQNVTPVEITTAGGYGEKNLKKLCAKFTLPNSG